MNTQNINNRLAEKTSLHSIQIELQQGYNLSPIEAQVLARRLQQLMDEQTGLARQPGQIIYHAVAIEESPAKPLSRCRKVPVCLSVLAEDDVQVWATEGPEALRRLRVHRLAYEALLQGGVLTQEDLAAILGLGLKTVKRIAAFFRSQGRPLPSRGEIRDMGRSVSHKTPVIRKYIQDVSLSRISLQLSRHGIPSMVRYLRHFALVMVLEDRGLTPAQMQSVLGISENLITEYRALYHELNVPEYARALERLKQAVFCPPETVEKPAAEALPDCRAEKGGL